MCLQQRLPPHRFLHQVLQEINVIFSYINLIFIYILKIYNFLFVAIVGNKKLPVKQSMAQPNSPGVKQITVKQMPKSATGVQTVQKVS